VHFFLFFLIYLQFKATAVNPLQIRAFVKKNERQAAHLDTPQTNRLVF